VKLPLQRAFSAGCNSELQLASGRQINTVSNRPLIVPSIIPCAFHHWLLSASALSTISLTYCALAPTQTLPLVGCDGSLQLDILRYSFTRDLLFAFCLLCCIYCFFPLISSTDTTHVIMLAQRLSRRAAAAAPRAGVRALATTASMQIRTPSMGDINPSPASIEQFNEKQRAFREHLVEAQRERGARAFGSQNFPDSDTPNQSSSENAAGATAEANSNAPDRKQGPLTNLIYGTKEANTSTPSCSTKSSRTR
jgi:hypothetical protein